MRVFFLFFGTGPMNVVRDKASDYIFRRVGFTWTACLDHCKRAIDEAQQLFRDSFTVYDRANRDHFGIY